MATVNSRIKLKIPKTCHETSNSVKGLQKISLGFIPTKKEIKYTKF